MIFSPKFVGDGFYDMECNSNVQSNLSINDGSESFSYYKADITSEID